MFLDLTKIAELHIEASSWCNLHCPQCPRFDEKGFLDKNLNQGHLDFVNIEKNLHLDLLPNLRYVKFEGDYGDPAMHPDLLKFVDFFQNIESLVFSNNLILKIFGYFIFHIRTISKQSIRIFQ